MAPGLFSIILIFQHLVIFIAFYFTLHLYHKKYQTYYLIISIRSHFANNREGINNPFIALGASWCLFVQGFGGLCVISYCIDTLVLKNRGKYLRYFVASPFPLQGKNQRKLKRQQKEFMAPLPGRSMPSQDIPSTHHKLSSLALHYQPFVSCFPLSHF